MDKNGLLLQVIAAHGANPDKKVILWRSSYGPYCNECAIQRLENETPLEQYEGFPKISFYGDKATHEEENLFGCLGCSHLLRDHS